MSEQENIQARQGTEQEITPALENTVSSTVPGLVSLACPVEGCGKVFERETIEQCYRAVKGHALSGHKIKLSRSDLGLPEEKREKPEKPRGRYVPKEEELPDEYNYLLSLLTEFGVQRAKPVADLMSRLSWDAYDALADYLELSGVRRDRIALVLESWSQHRGTKIPEEVSRKVKVPQYVGKYDRYGFRRRGYGEERDVDRLIDQQLERKTKLGLLRGLESGEEGGKIMTDIAYRLGQLEAQIQNRGSAEVNPPVNPAITNLQEQVNKLTEKLEEEREKRREDRFSKLEKTIEGVRDEVKKGQSQTTDALVQAVRSTEAVVKEGIGIYKAYVKARFGMSEKPPEREKVEGKSSILNYIPEEYIEKGD